MTIQKRRYITYLPLLWVILMLVFSEDVLNAVKNALLLCGQTIIPSLFPFMIASDLLMQAGIDNIKMPPFFEKTTWRLFRVSATGFCAFFMGALCGFPIGAKFIADLCRSGKIDAEEAARLLCFCNNTGPAFLIAGIGISLLHSKALGFVLYCIQILSALLCGLLFARFEKKSPRKQLCTHVEAKSKDFPSVIRDNVQNMLTVCGAILLFSSILGLLGELLQNRVLLGVIASFLEIGTASAIASNLFLHIPKVAFLLLTLAVNFGGFSVHMQAACLFRDLPISFRRYIVAKWVQACIALLLSLFYILS